MYAVSTYPHHSIEVTPHALMIEPNVKKGKKPHWADNINYSSKQLFLGLNEKVYKTVPGVY